MDPDKLFSGRLLSERELVILAMNMSKHVPVSDRVHQSRTYEKVFVGKEAVAWLMSSGATDETEAIRFGNQMLCVGLMHHGANEHLFENEELFYRYHLDPREPRFIGDALVQKAGGAQNTQDYHPGSVSSLLLEILTYGTLRPISPILTEPEATPTVTASENAEAEKAYWKAAYSRNRLGFDGSLGSWSSTPEYYKEEPLAQMTAISADTHSRRSSLAAQPPAAVYTRTSWEESRAPYEPSSTNEATSTWRSSSVFTQEELSKRSMDRLGFDGSLG
mmetsp:Transcript_33587/g.56407  ORF Transcript_33587/g.56407 Transcript_33587/m.56407 type:complete len:276 (-) Transcript_33587:9-836(-)|eukprot:CAMPEP_0198201722 /NCGR_PEP_ID=MMETSP1445-20131203/4708_1 /TAXON_ID=36898 /ORGANISM="Pyramimonas sp., Strain CCMP2087" /LENGTH=275 /DNA_ID=CAMNT_0043872283 /DNA_START=424 /DNA_END=1247 /DNA_ORIENTATION=-